jgi:hypothetical protein
VKCKRRFCGFAVMGVLINEVCQPDQFQSTLMKGSSYCLLNHD